MFESGDDLYHVTYPQQSDGRHIGRNHQNHAFRAADSGGWLSSEFFIKYFITQFLRGNYFVCVSARSKTIGLSSTLSTESSSHYLLSQYRFRNVSSLPDVSGCAILVNLVRRVKKTLFLQRFFQVKNIMQTGNPTRFLFACTGNICRSPWLRPYCDIKLLWLVCLGNAIPQGHMPIMLGAS